MSCPRSKIVSLAQEWVGLNEADGSFQQSVFGFLLLFRFTHKKTPFMFPRKELRQLLKVNFKRFCLPHRGKQDRFYKAVRMLF